MTESSSECVSTLLASRRTTVQKELLLYIDGFYHSDVDESRAESPVDLEALSQQSPGKLAMELTTRLHRGVTTLVKELVRAVHRLGGYCRLVMEPAGQGCTQTGWVMSAVSYTTSRWPSGLERLL